MADQLTEPSCGPACACSASPSRARRSRRSPSLSVTAPGATNPLPAGDRVRPRARRGRAGVRDGRRRVGAAGRGRGDLGAVARGRRCARATLRTTTAAPATGGELSLLLEVAAAPGVAPAWSPDAVDVEPAAELRWEAIGPAGTTARGRCPRRHRRATALRTADARLAGRLGRGGRRRSAPSRGRDPLLVYGGGPDRGGLSQRGDRPAPGSAYCRRLRAVAPFLPLPERAVSSRTQPDDCSTASGDVVMTVTERDGQRHDWTGVRSWVAIGPEDRVFLVDRDGGRLLFGDGRAGRILRPGQTPDAQVRYALGAGHREPRGGGGVGGGRRGRGRGQPGPRGGRSRSRVARARAPARRRRAHRARSHRHCGGRERPGRDPPGLGLARAHASPVSIRGSRAARSRARCRSRSSRTPTATASRATGPPRRSRTRARSKPCAGGSSGRGCSGQEIFVLAPEYRGVAVDLSVSATPQTGDARGRTWRAAALPRSPRRGLGAARLAVRRGCAPVGVGRRGAAAARPRGDRHAAGAGPRRRGLDGLRGCRDRRARAGVPRVRERPLGRRAPTGGGLR